MEREGNIHPLSFFSGAEHIKLFLRRVGSHDGDLQTDKFQYEVLEAERVIGRIAFDHEAVGATKWFWEVSGAARGKYFRKGSAGSLHDAKIAVANAVDRIRKSDEGGQLR